jgi:hypothetical protein
MSDLTREIKFLRAFDKRDPDPNKNYGIHGVDMTWYVKGVEGAVQFKVFTNWHMPKVRDEWIDRDRAGDPPPLCVVMPMAADLGYHSPVAQYEGQEPVSDSCELLGGTCYYDGSGLNAQPVFDILITEGEEACWKALEKYYYETFSNEHET